MVGVGLVVGRVKKKSRKEEKRRKDEADAALPPFGAWYDAG